MKRISTKLGILILATTICLLGLAAMIISQAQREFNQLSNFKTTVAVSQQLYDYTLAIGNERYAAWFAINTNRDGTAKDQVAAFRKSSETTQSIRESLLANIEANKHAFSERFRNMAVTAIQRDEVLIKLRAMILDPSRNLEKEERPINTESNRIYEGLRIDLEAIFPTLVLETDEAGAIRLIQMQDIIGRLKAEFFRVRGLVSAALRSNRLTHANVGLPARSPRTARQRTRPEGLQKRHRKPAVQNHHHLRRTDSQDRSRKK
jgi:hypothetical protein